MPTTNSSFSAAAAAAAAVLCFDQLLPRFGIKHSLFRCSMHSDLLFQLPVESDQLMPLTTWSFLFVRLCCMTTAPLFVFDSEVKSVWPLLSGAATGLLTPSSRQYRGWKWMPLRKNENTETSMLWWLTTCRSWCKLVTRRRVVPLPLMVGRTHAAFSVCKFLETFCLWRIRYYFARICNL